MNEKSFSMLAWLRENGLPDDYFCPRIVAFGSLLFDPPTPESNRRAAMRCRGLDEAGWPLRDGP